MTTEKKKKILVVEDEKAMSHALQLKLEKEGFTVTLAENGEKAKEEVESGSFDLILLDLIMPEMDGFTFLKEIKEKGKDKTPVIVLSNLSQPEDEEKVHASGADAFYIKSNTTITEVVSEVKRFLNKD